MSRVDQGVVPTSMERPKRIAKRLHQIYPLKPLSACQATVAHLYFHQDWHALEQAVKQKASSAPFLDDLSDEDYFARRDAQFQIVCRELGDVDPDEAYARPEEPPSKTMLTSAELGEHLLAKEALLPQRERQAAGRYRKLLAQEAIEELWPTAKDVSKPVYFDVMPLVDEEVVRSLPGQIAAWWALNIPHQDVVANAWRTMELDPNSRIAVLRAGGYWSTLCFHYGRTIDWTMVMGVTFLFATRYAGLVAQDDPRFDTLVLTATNEDLPDTDRKHARAAIDTLIREATIAFMDVLSRDDLAGVFRAQPGAFVANAEETLAILAKPKRGAGTWGDR